MRAISKLSRFKSDFKKMLKVPRYQRFDETLDETVSHFVAGTSLPESLLDHPLKRIWTRCRECHLRLDLLLIYRHDGQKNTTLLRLGTHSELFG